MKEKYLFQGIGFIFVLSIFLFLFSFPSLALIPGDFNGDGCVQFEDLMILALAYGSCEGDNNWNPVCDIAGPGGNPEPDGVINFEDLMIFALHYGECVINPSDPGTVELIVLGSGSYDLKMDGVTCFFDKPVGTYAISDVPVGSHTFEAINMEGVSCYYDSVTEYISTGLTSIYLDPVLSIPDIGLATVTEIEILILETFPVQVLVNASGYHPDPCTNIYQIYQIREGNTFFINITTYRPPGICITVIDPFTETITLEVNELPAGTYIVDVNGVQSSFTLETDNISLIN